ncbi:trypsin-like serine peptidase [Streptomyces cavernae]|uniref:trypsin-like serine peptidase n=1 Tax=Streptomyces cavernae TaxID=2259034 RepID=UPI000FEBDEDD|nr:hypothetical protein [Streptomyces cavernae]
MTASKVLPRQRRGRIGVLLATIVMTSACTVGGEDGIGPSGARLHEWRNGGWQDWSADTWPRDPGSFWNPVIDGLWSPERMRAARDPVKEAPVENAEAAGDADRAPEPTGTETVPVPHRRTAPAVGKIFFDTPRGPSACSGTVVRDPARPGRSSLVWTAAHCLHAGKEGGWFRNISFVPSFNERAVPTDARLSASGARPAPFGQWWADWAATPGEWRSEGTAAGAAGAAFDYAVLHVTPPAGAGGTSLEETVGAALPVAFDTLPRAVGTVGIWGYPAGEAAADGATLRLCTGRPRRGSVTRAGVAMHRVGCGTTGRSSGGGWLATDGVGGTVLVSNTSTASGTSAASGSTAWLAGPMLGASAGSVLHEVSARYGTN